MIVARTRSLLSFLYTLSLVALATPAVALADGNHSCGDLLSARLNPPADAQNLTIDSATLVAGTPELPEHCFVQGHLEAEINFEMKLPTAWNGKLYMRGNSAFAGYIPWLDDVVAERYAAIGTDTGHSGGPEELLNRPDRITNFQYRAVHLVALTGRLIARKYYHNPPRHFYFEGYSGGGRQAMLEVQQYPDDFDGVIAGAPNLASGNFPGGGFQLWNMRTLFPVGANTGVLPSPKVTLLSQLVFQKCDALDGIVDGIVDDPRACNLTPQNDLPRCANDADAPDCFTRAQVNALTLIHQGPFSKGRRLGPRFYFSGAEGYAPWGADPYGVGLPALDFAETESGYPDAGVPSWLYPDGWGPGIPSFDYWLQTNQLINIVFGDPNYLLENFDFNSASDVRTYLEALQPMFASNPDLTAFARKGGKLIEYHGWGDSVINPMLTVQFYEAGAREAGGIDRMKPFSRLFMVPGMTHYTGGPGPYAFDALPALEKWVEAGEAPESLLGTNPDSGLSRPICAYPKVARLKSSSLDPNLASSFVCVDVQDDQASTPQ